MTDPLIVKSIRKTYHAEGKTIEALKGVSFSVEKGEIFGLLGPNGAGKTTAINIITGLLEKDSGEVLFFGKALDEESKHRINAMNAYNFMNGTLTVEQYMRIYGMLYNIKNREQRMNELITLFEIDELRKQRVEDLSAGQRALVNFCKSLLNKPEVLFLDEPTIGLDPEVAQTVRGVIKNLDATIIFTSHIMTEVEELCDRVAFINHGRITHLGSPQELKRYVQEELHVKEASMHDVFMHLSRRQP